MSHVALVGPYEFHFDTEQIDRILNNLALGISEPSLLAWLKSDAAEHIESDIAARFASEGDNKSGPWAALHEPTLRIREELGYGSGPINKRTGDLEAFVMTGKEFLVGSEWVEMQIPGSPPDPVTAKKLETAQRGSKSNPIPNFGSTQPRPVLAIDETDLWTLMQSLENHITLLMGVGGALSEVA